MELREILSQVGQAVEDAEEESFDIFCEELPSGNLGFIDSQADEIDITVNGRDFAIKQSPTILSSSRAGGTTGAVLWKITPLVADWLSDNSNFLWKTSILSPDSTVAELGCGISGLIPLTLAPMVQNCIVTDQEYVHKLLKENLQRNYPCGGNIRDRNIRDNRTAKTTDRNKPPRQPRSTRSKPHKQTQAFLWERTGNIAFTPLDWETDYPAELRQVLKTTSATDTSSNLNDDDADGEDRGFDLLIACDTIYNEALVPSFVQTCAEICRLRPAYNDGSVNPMATETKDKPTLCVVAQHLRSSDVFEAWCRETMKWFHVWRLKNEETDGTLGMGSGCMVHLLVLKTGA